MLLERLSISRNCTDRMKQVLRDLVANDYNRKQMSFGNYPGLYVAEISRSRPEQLYFFIYDGNILDLIQEPKER